MPSSAIMCAIPHLACRRWHRCYRWSRRCRWWRLRLHKGWFGLHTDIFHLDLCTACGRLACARLRIASRLLIRNLAIRRLVRSLVLVVLLIRNLVIRRLVRSLALVVLLVRKLSSVALSSCTGPKIVSTDDICVLPRNGHQPMFEKINPVLLKPCFRPLLI